MIYSTKRKGNDLMETVETFLLNSNLADPDDIDSLLNLADLVRQLIRDKEYEKIGRIIKHTVENSFFEAFSWAMEILQEEFAKAEGLDDFSCELGKSIDNYNEFIQRIGCDLKVLRNEVETVMDDKGEVQSFFNIFCYATKYANIFFVSTENFDTKDNDFIHYKLSFSRKA